MPYDMNTLNTEYSNLDNPSYVGNLIAQRQHANLPYFYDLLKKVKSNMAASGLYSESPIATAGAGIAGNINAGIENQVYGDLESRRMPLLNLMQQLKMHMDQMSAEDKAGWMKLISGIIGTGAGLIPDLGPKTS